MLSFYTRIYIYAHTSIVIAHENIHVFLYCHPQSLFYLCGSAHITMEIWNYILILFLYEGENHLYVEGLIKLGLYLRKYNALELLLAGNGHFTEVNNTKIIATNLKTSHSCQMPFSKIIRVVLCSLMALMGCRKDWFKL